MPDLYTRIATDVEAMQLCTPRDLHVADVWLRAHGVESAHRHPVLGQRALGLIGSGGMVTVAKLGQWLALDLTTGQWGVVDDDVFTLVHRPADVTAVADATR